MFHSLFKKAWSCSPLPLLSTADGENVRPPTETALSLCLILHTHSPAISSLLLHHHPSLSLHFACLASAPHSNHHEQVIFHLQLSFQSSPSSCILAYHSCPLSLLPRRTPIASPYPSFSPAASYNPRERLVQHRHQADGHRLSPLPPRARWRLRGRRGVSGSDLQGSDHRAQRGTRCGGGLRAAQRASASRTQL